MYTLNDNLFTTEHPCLAIHTWHSSIHSMYAHVYTHIHTSVRDLILIPWKCYVLTYDIGVVSINYILQLSVIYKSNTLHRIKINLLWWRKRSVDDVLIYGSSLSLVIYVSFKTTCSLPLSPSLPTRPILSFCYDMFKFRPFIMCSVSVLWIFVFSLSFVGCPYKSFIVSTLFFRHSSHSS